MLMNIKINYICDKAIVGVAQGDMNALSDIYDSIGKQVYFVAYSILKNHNDAEDILQQVFCEIVKNAHAYRSGSNARAWILSIARNQALKYLRDKKTCIPLEDVTNSFECSEADEDFISNLTMFEALKVLSEQDRQIVLLHIEGGMKFKEIANLLNITVDSAKKKYQRALKKLSTYYN